ncbi:MAG: DUF4252 domain-containing protein [Muribaculaceae bacterium]|nr:DUF4252 domain-containing protein [Muribaculaceae bacterium]
MKKILLLAIVALTFATGLGKTVDEVFSAFPAADNVQLMDMPFMKQIVQSKLEAELKEENGKQIKIEDMKLLLIEDATESQKDIARHLLNDGVDGMEELMNVDEDGNLDVTIFFQKEGDHICQMLIFTFDNDEDEVGIVYLKGAMQPSDIGKIDMFN